MIVNAELAEKADLSILDVCVVKRNLRLGREAEGFVELLNLRFKTSVDGRPYISLTMRDIMGEVLYGTIFEYEMKTDTLTSLNKIGNMYAAIVYVPIILGSSVHLQVKEINFCEDKDNIEKLNQAFKLEFDKFDAYFHALQKIDFGVYQDIADKVLWSSDFKAQMREVYWDACGICKRGYLAKTLFDITGMLQLMEIDIPAARFVAIWSLWFYSKYIPKETFRYANYITPFLKMLDMEINSLYAKMECTQGKNPLLDRLVRDIMICIYDLAEIPTNYSQVSIVLCELFKFYRKQVETVNTLNIVPAGTLTIDGRTVIIEK